MAVAASRAQPRTRRPAGSVATSPRPWTAVGPREAPAIVFVHGTRLTRNLWRPQLRRLSDRYRCVAIDLPGHGERADEAFSMQAASDAVIAAIEAEVPSGRAVVVGLSLGGYVAIDAAERCPDRIAGLVLSGCSAEPVGPVGALFRALAWGLDHAPEGPLGVVNRGYFRLRYGHAIADPIVEGGFWDAGRRGGAPGAGQDALRRAPGAPVDPGPRRQRRPRPRVRARWRPLGRGLPAGRHVVFARAMHLASLDRPGAFSDLVAAFAADPTGTV